MAARRRGVLLLLPLRGARARGGRRGRHGGRRRGVLLLHLQLRGAQAQGNGARQHGAAASGGSSWGGERGPERHVHEEEGEAVSLTGGSDGGEWWRGGITASRGARKRWRGTAASEGSGWGGERGPEQGAHEEEGEAVSLTGSLDGGERRRGGVTASRGGGGRRSSPGSLRERGKLGVTAGISRTEGQDAAVARNCGGAHHGRRIEDGRIWG